MKRITLSLLVSLSVIVLFAQTPEAFQYQAVARDAGGVVLADQDVSFRIFIIEGSAVGTSVYSEIHPATTNPFGLVNLEIGNGTVVTGVFADINWGDNLYFLQIEMDETGNTNYQLLGTSQLLSVPYALHSETTSDTTRWRKNATDLYFSNGNVGIGKSNPYSSLDVYGQWGFAVQAKNDLNATGLLAYSNYGVFGEIHDASGSGAGVLGQCFTTNDVGALGRSGMGVFGSSDTWAGYFEGKGYFEDYVGFGTTNPAAAIDVYGQWGWALQAKNELNATALLAYGDNGVLGETYDGSGNSAGVVGQCFTTNDVGALGRSGMGVFGSSDTWAGYFEGKGYFEDYVGFGTTNPAAAIDVYGPWGFALQAKNELNAIGLLAYGNDGVLGETHDASGGGAGVVGRCFITDDVGALGRSGMGVFGSSDTWAGYFEGNVFMDGNLGIGTTSPDAIIDIVSTGNGFLNIGRNTDFLGGINYKENGTTQWIFPFFRGWQSDNLIVRDEGSYLDVMTFEYGTGCVGIGTNTPGGYKLYVNGTAYSSGGWTGSDEKLKKNISEIQNSTEILTQLKGVSYNFRQEEYPEKSLPDGKHFGVIAQDVEKILPDMVNTGPDGMKAVAYDELIPILIEALKEQQARIDYLDKKIEDLSKK